MNGSCLAHVAGRGLAASIVILALSALPASAEEQSDFGTIAVVGQGSVAATPDSAEIQVAVITTDTQAASAVAANSAQMTSVLRSLAGLGIQERQTATERFEISPRFRRASNQDQAPEITGYAVTNRLRVTVTDLKILGQVLDAVVAAGANRVENVTMTLSDTEPLLDQARKKAMEDARHKAELILASAGLKLGPVLSIEEKGSALPVPRALALAESAAVPVRPGEQVVRSGLGVTFAIGGPAGE